MLKTSALVAVTGSVNELFTTVQHLYSQNMLIMPLLIVACIWYIFFTTLFTIGQHYLERYFGRGFGTNETVTAERKAQKRLQHKVTADVGEPGNWD
jgi:polar amino acid transport system permease protein